MCDLLRQADWPELAGLQVGQLLEPEQRDVEPVAAVVVAGVDVYLVIMISCYQCRYLCKVVKFSPHLVDAVRLPEVVEVLGALAAAHHHPQVHRPVLGGSGQVTVLSLHTSHFVMSKIMNEHSGS